MSAPRSSRYRPFLAPKWPAAAVNRQMSEQIIKPISESCLRIGQMTFCPVPHHQEGWMMRVQKSLQSCSFPGKVLTMLDGFDLHRCSSPPFAGRLRFAISFSAGHRSSDDHDKGKLLWDKNIYHTSYLATRGLVEGLPTSEVGVRNALSPCKTACLWNGQEKGLSTDTIQPSVQPFGTPM